MKRKLLVVLSLVVITSGLQADFFDSIISKVSDKLEHKAENVVENKVDSMLDGEPEVTEAKPVQVASKNDKVGKLRELIEMKKNGYITDSEFQKQKALILN